MSSENVLGALFWKLPMVRKDAGFGGEIIEMTLGRRQLKLTMMLVGRHIY